MIRRFDAGSMAIALVACAAIACSSSAGSRDGSVNDAATGGAGGAAGSGPGGSGGAAGAGSGGTAGAGGTSAPACPSAPPASGAGCGAAQSCFYEDCTDTGRTIARCMNGVWSIESGPCNSVMCQGQTCPVGQICLERAGGALLVQCVQNTCGTGPIGCGCLQSCAGDCAVGGSLPTGVTVQCNTCPANTCP